jgi:hypothetical protein
MDNELSIATPGLIAVVWLRSSQDFTPRLTIVGFNAVSVPLVWDRSALRLRRLADALIDWHPDDVQRVDLEWV